MRGMMTFQRARSEEQRRIRRQTILDTTAAMLDEMPVSELSLNELSRRVGLAKSNVLRYFESREAILLELLDQSFNRWTGRLPADLEAAIDPRAPAWDRGDQLAAVLTRSLAHQSVLCDLLSAQAGVLEHNVSTDVAVRYKKAALAGISTLAEIVRRHLPELDETTAWLLSGQTIILIGTVWTHTRPSPSVLAAYEADPTLACMRMDFATALEQSLATYITGTLARLTRASDHADGRVLGAPED